jgi:dTDP-4-dehydrorhamnose 3,5-epimerase
MTFASTSIVGAFLLRPERHQDDRGFFARTYCVRELADHGLETRVVQRSVSHNLRRGTLRGMHLQVSPHEETKIVSCVRGAIYDVIVDLRPDSSSFRRWHAVALTADEGQLLYIPRGCAHGFITLIDDVVVDYQISEFHHPEAARGFRYDDPAFGISWPMAPVVISERDQAFPPYGAA